MYAKCLESLRTACLFIRTGKINRYEAKRYFVQFLFLPIRNAIKNIDTLYFFLAKTNENKWL